MKDEKVVMYDAPEAASIQTVTGWVSRTGHYWGQDEHMARYDGSTHKKCDVCGEVVARNNYCRPCDRRKQQEKFEAMPFKPYDGSSPVYSEHLSKFFFGGMEDALDYLANEEGLTEEGMMLVHCHPRHLHKLDTDVWEDELSTDDGEADIPGPVADALSALNAAIKEAGPVTWEPDAIRVPISETGGSR